MSQLKWTTGCFRLLGLGLAAVLGLVQAGCVASGCEGSSPDNFNFNFNGNSSGNDNAPGNENLNANDNAAERPPIVRLTVNNAQPFVGDQVDLTCSVLVGQSSIGVRYAFQPSSTRLIVNATAGTAFFIVDQSDVGLELRFTCTGANAAGTGEPSNSVSVFPSSPPFLP